MQIKLRLGYIVFLGLSLISSVAFAVSPVVNLTVGYKTVDFAGKSVQAIAVNNQIPGPTLHFKDGDNVTINVYNHLDKGTAIHWHGLLVPWQMDGVEGVSQHAIPPDGVFHYQFTLKQSGTYWYHAHAGLQEQQGLYGGIIIDPRKSPAYKYNKDYVIVLSDWINTKPEQVYANLKKDGDYYSTKFPIQPSLLNLIQHYSPELLDNYKMMEKMRMNIYDYSDVAYDAFLLNGHSNKQPWTAPVKVGDTVRLRFIDAGSSTLFHVKIPGTIMEVVDVQGHDVRPYYAKELEIAPAETYDVLVKITKNSPYIIYAESSDTLGAAYGALIENPYQKINFHAVKPFPTPEPVTAMGSDMSMSGMSMPGMDMSPKTKYENLKAVYVTNNPNIKPVETIKMVLSGYMGRYIWFINGKPGYEAKPILIEPGKRYRFMFINDSMMHHPMHIHGHFFILRNGHGKYDPLLHTIDVPPGETVVADIDADASGQWFFHCHNLYHMMSGMSRIFQYTTAKKQFPDNHLIEHPMGHPAGLYQATFLDMGEDPFNNIQQVSFKSLTGGDFNKLELYSEDAEMRKGIVESADADIFCWHLLDQYWAIKAGANYFYRPAETPYWQPGIGIEGLAPYFIDTNIRTYYHSGSEKFDIQLSRDSQITNKLFIRTGIRSILATKTVTEDEVGSGLNQLRFIIRPYYQLEPGLAVFTEFEHEGDYGSFRNIVVKSGEPASQNVITFGVSLLF